MKFSDPALKHQFVQKGFSRIAARYDCFNDIVTFGLHRFWKKAVVNQLSGEKGMRILDLCCGTGDLAILAQKKNPEAEVWGLDFSPEMLQLAQTKDSQGTVSFLLGDALQLPLEANAMDAVMVGFGLRNLADLQKGLREVYRVLKPGGCFLCLEMGKIKNPLLYAGFKFFFFRLLPLIGRLFFGGDRMYNYFPQSTLTYPVQDVFSALLEEQGFIEVHYQNFIFGGVVLHHALKKTE